jgi:hypothetical protein
MMKLIKKTLMAGLAGFAIILTISSCQKSYDPKTYAPTKPLPTFGGYNSSKEIEPASLVAYWPFNNSLTDSISQATGVAAGTTFTSGITGKGLQGAANSYALCDASTALKNLQSFTISVWLNTPPPSNGIIGFFSIANTQNFWGNIEMFFENGSDNTNGKIRVHMSQNGSDNTYSIDGVPNLFNTTVNVVNWVNITVSYNQTGGTCTLYVNGVSKNTGAAGSLTGPLAFTNVGKVVFGTVQFMTTPSQTSSTGKKDWASYLTGQMDQVRVYNKVLSSSEISALYNLEKLGR